MSSAKKTASKQQAPEKLDPVWVNIRREAEEAASREPQIASFLYSSVLDHPTLEQAIAFRVSELLGHADVSAMMIRQAFDNFYSDDAHISGQIRADIAAYLERDPACNRHIDPLLYYKGFQAVQSYRLSHWLWRHDRRDFAFYLQSRTSKSFGVDIHPAANLGRGIFIDHAHAIVIGETAIVDDEVSILHDVTLGGTGKEHGDRHPKIRQGVLIGAGAKILGNIEVGCCARIAAGSVVLSDVPPQVTVAGVPAKIIGEAGCEEPALAMDHTLASDGQED